MGPAPGAAAAAAATEEPPPPPALLPVPEEKGKGKEPARALKKRKRGEEQDEAALSQTLAAAAVADASAAKAGGGGALDKHVADAPRSSDDDGSKTKKRKADQDQGGGSIDDDEMDADDQVQVHVHREEAESRVQNIGSPTGSPILFEVAVAPRRRRKKLLILDLNGLLADINQDKHNAHLSHGKFRGKLVFKRPYCDDFLRFCIQHFELGIWSSRLRANVDAVVNILMEDLKHRLLFCWDMSKCTGTGLNTLENRVKPLVLKELKKLWDKEEPDDLPWQQGDFSPSNTLLVDDSPYKALRNPPHTAICPCPYSYKNDKDDALGPDGDLRLYLEGLAAADDVQCYVREHPFGQPPITETDPDWEFYRRILIE